MLIEFQRRLDVISCLFIGNAFGDILADLVVGDTYPIYLIVISSRVTTNTPHSYDEFPRAK